MAKLDPEAGPPASRLLRHGDLLWPKGKNARILYLYNDETEGTPALLAAEKLEWESEQRDFCARPDNPDMTPEERAYLCALSYDEFRNIYGVGSADEGPQILGGLVSVGHVAIVDKSDGAPRVIEALNEKGVIRRTYQEWAADHHDDLVWLGRLKNPVARDPERFVAKAREQIDKPYRFWNLDLLNEEGFYCSKLVWFALYQSYGVAMDGKANPKRGKWYSPRQSSRSAYVDMLTEGHYLVQ